MLDIPQAVDNIMKLCLLLRCYTYQNIAEPWEHHILLRRRGGGGGGIKELKESKFVMVK